jgi:hypothetical protein
MKKINFRFCSAILDYRKQLNMSKRCLLVAPTYSADVTKAHILTPNGSAVVVKRSAWAHFPLVIGRLKLKVHKLDLLWLCSKFILQQVAGLVESCGFVVNLLYNKFTKNRRLLECELLSVKANVTTSQ